jgi:hypothetical protein
MRKTVNEGEGLPLPPGAGTVLYGFRKSAGSEGCSCNPMFCTLFRKGMGFSLQIRKKVQAYSLSSTFTASASGARSC